MTAYRLEYLHGDSRYKYPGYGDCWWPCMPNRKYTRLDTCFRLMREHVDNSTAPAFRHGATRIVGADDGRVVAMEYHRSVR
jgi:hypothetical protein